MTQSHTKTPWKMPELTLGFDNIIQVGTNYFIAPTEEDRCIPDRHAAFIVKSVNEHQPMADLIRDVMIIIANSADFGPSVAFREIEERVNKFNEGSK